MVIKSSRGYSLSEAMITVAIVGTLTAVSAPLLRNMINFWRQTTARIEIERDVRSSLDTINRFLRQARKSSVVISRAGTQPPFSKISFTTAADQNVSFYQSANSLIMTYSSSTAASSAVTTSTLSLRVGYIAFTYPRTDDNTIISVATTMQSPTYLGGKKALQLSISKVRIMN